MAVGGPVAELIDVSADFEIENPEIRVQPIYAGTYQEALVKSLTAPEERHAARPAVLFAADMYTLIDDDAIVPFDEFATRPSDRRGCRASSRRSWKTVEPPARPGRSVQRSTILLYWNKAHFRETGLDPDKPPATGKRGRVSPSASQRGANGTVTSRGIQIPSSGFPYWLFQASRRRQAETLPKPQSEFSVGYFELAAALHSQAADCGNCRSRRRVGQIAMAGAREHAKRHGFKIVHDQSYPPATVDFTSIVRSIKVLDPDLVYI